MTSASSTAMVAVSIKKRTHRGGTEGAEKKVLITHTPNSANSVPPW